ncbi:hypothetical protein P154DRAFT_524256 [Amniculicola lignicola CBS 123094]|uniref:Uncharacterized protein n=1 Tax=Amniculicola lignicola CBS 123094 TaxID=1392246 RepID=A0A6A5W8T0_9PLEO|nr:hypothetical protein P154DRAFT_524256 [Amniculicola lignicola CBS 123094]
MFILSSLPTDAYGNPGCRLERGYTECPGGYPCGSRPEIDVVRWCDGCRRPESSDMPVRSSHLVARAVTG